MSDIRKFLMCVTLFSSSFLLAEEPVAQTQKASHFHAVVASGYAWSMEADIRGIDYDFWAPALEGYDSSLGNSPFIMLGFGYRLRNVLDIDFDYTLYDTFHYQKNQTDPFENQRTRYFDLNHQSALINFTYFPYAFHVRKVEITPFIGMAAGVGINQVSDFHTVFYDPSQGFGITTSIGKSRTTTSFAWQGTGGFRIHPNCSCLSLDLAYRYDNGGTFKTSSSEVNYNGVDQGQTEHGKPWKGTLQTNQLYFAINFAI